MPSSYTQNLGIEQPATGEQANTWGITVNRNMDTLDTAINGNIPLTLNSSPYQLTINNGQDSPSAANPVIIWSGSPGTVQIDWQSNRKHLYCMSNRQASGVITFTQGSGSPFVLQAGYDALIYSDGGGSSANVAAALGNPQFNNLLLTGAAQMNGALTVNGALHLGAAVMTADGNGAVHFSGALGLGNPSVLNDMLTINGLGPGLTSQIRMVYSNIGVLFRNDGQSFYMMVTNANDAYGGWTGNFPIWVDLPTRNVGIGGWGPSPSYSLQTPTLHVSTLVADGSVNVGGTLGVANGFSNASGRSYFKSGDNYQIGLYNPAGNLTWIGTNVANQFQLSNPNGTAMLVVDASGNAAFGGGVHSLSGGFQFPDGTIQTTAAQNYVPGPPVNNFPGNITVNGVIYGGSGGFQSPTFYCFPFSGAYANAPPNSCMLSHNEASNYVTIWVWKSDGTRWIANIPLGQT